MKTIRVHPSAQLVWSMANKEACLAGSETIEPLHLFLALLKILDEAFHQDAERFGLTPDEISELTETAAAGRLLMGMPDEEITRLRRSIGNALRSGQINPSIEMLHRSPECLKLFDQASEHAVQERAPFLRFLHILRAILLNTPPDVARYLPSRTTQKPTMMWETRIDEFVSQFQLKRISLVLTDMESSTSIKQRNGDVESAKIFRAHDDMFRQQLSRFHQAREIKTIGDSFLLSFASEEEAVRFALVVQSELRQHKYLSQVPVKVRIGIHSGEILSKVAHGSGLSDPIFGITIDITSRIASLASGDQILVSRQIYDKASAETTTNPPPGLGQVRWTSHGTYALKGLPTPVEIFEVGEAGKAAFVRPGTNEKATSLEIESTMPLLSPTPQASRGSGTRPAAPQASRGSGTRPAAPSPPAPVVSRADIGRDLTALAREGRLPVMVGRKDEVKTLARYLQRASKRSVMLVGASGVGKSALVEGLAQHSILDNAPPALRSLQIIQIDTAELVSRTSARVDLERRLRAIIDEAATDPGLVLFFDDVHLAFDQPPARRPSGIRSIVRGALVRSDLSCIGATTPEYFDRYLNSDSAIPKSVHLLQIREPSVEEAIQICHEHAHRIEGIQNVVFTEDSIVGAVLLSARLIPERSLPEKAIDILENAAAFTKVSSLTVEGAILSKEAPRIGRKLIENVLQKEYGLSVMDDSMATRIGTE